MGMKRYTLIPAATLAALASFGGIAAADGPAGSTTPSDNDLSRASDAALAETGEGIVTGFEVDRNGYDVEVLLDDATEIDVDLDGSFAVVNTHTDAHDDDEFMGSVADIDLQQAYDAALTEAGGGTVTSVDVDSRGGYDVEVRLDDNSEIEIELDSSFEVVRTERDD